MSDTRIMCSLSRVTSKGESTLFLPSSASAGALRFQRYGVFGLILAPDLSQAPLHAPSPFCPPLFQHVEEPVAHRGVGVNFAALGIAATGLVLNECTGWNGRGGTGSADVVL